MVGVGLQIDWVVVDGFCGRFLDQESWGLWVMGGGTGNTHGLLGFVA